MKIDFNQTLTDIDGKLIQTSAEDESPITLGTLCRNALLPNYQREQNVSADEKMKRWALARKTQRGVVDLKVEEIAKLKECAALGYAPAILGPICDLLDPQTHEAEAVQETPKPVALAAKPVEEPSKK